MNKPLDETTKMFAVGYAVKGEYTAWRNHKDKFALGELVQGMNGNSFPVQLVMRDDSGLYVVVSAPSVYVDELQKFCFVKYRVFMDEDQAIMCALMWRD